ncbi:3-dehydroquinate synthase II [Paludibacterium purpuratum]|uniref:3-amino-4-hydroxybenzoic acid synthase n=1 Tax=Paludibacterium purpuratum TaxID=1144873 RepID=A0A4R7AZ17_9NEIS|nr:3-dehydroquinate synthase II [Paludibacterium purpuratum]TDR73330.1 3-amino-4-hydroxybenzoic acid synthase [Paludibacterium purpuratum]
MKSNKALAAEKQSVPVHVINSLLESEAAPVALDGATVHGAGETQWWFDARDAKDDALLEAVEKSNCTHVVLNLDQLAGHRSNKQKVVWLDNISQLENLEDGVWVFTASEDIRRAAIAKRYKAGLLISVNDLEKEFPYCIAVCERGDDFVVIDIEHATYIPYELLLAKAEGKKTKILRSVPIKGLKNIVQDVDQSLNAFATMEQGVGVLFKTSQVGSIQSLSKNLQGRQSSQLSLLSAEVVEVQHTGLGSRVCVDTTSMMTAEEGMIIGSTGWGGIFVCSETHYLPHMNLREFRVNAGAVHSYIWGKDGTAMYLSEMEAGSEVLCTNKNGTARVVSIGRAKIERRPLLKIKCRVPLSQVDERIAEAARKDALLKRNVTPNGESIASADENYIYLNTFLQNDWHVRVMGDDGKIRHCTLLQPGDRVMAYVDLPGRHTGLRVTEHILEK